MNITRTGFGYIAVETILAHDGPVELSASGRTREEAAKKCGEWVQQALAHIKPQSFCPRDLERATL